jgi:hypothetical protein
MAKGKKTGGRKKGSTNKVTVAVKDALTQAFSLMGGVKALAASAAFAGAADREEAGALPGDGAGKPVGP